VQVDHPVCCGIDVHKDTLTVCLRRVDANGQVSKEGREFATISTSLLALSAWLVEQRCPMGAMESTGVSWTPVDHVFAGTVEACIGNAPERHSPYCGAGTSWPRWALLCVALGPRRTWPRGLGDVLGIMRGPANGTEAKRARGSAPCAGSWCKVPGAPGKHPPSWSAPCGVSKCVSARRRLRWPSPISCACSSTISSLWGPVMRRRSTISSSRDRRHASGNGRSKL